MKTFFISQTDVQNQMPFERDLFCEANAAGKIFLLLYSWNGAVISTGRLQKKLNINRESCEKDGVKIVERLTGGRAVFHLNDICYSLSIPARFVKNTGENLKEAIFSISRPIIKTFADFAIFADVQTGENGRRGNFLHSDFCAQTQTDGEIRINGKKIVASSQSFSQEGILQHGTIPISGDYLRICDYFAGKNESEREKTKELLRQNTTCLNEVCAALNVRDFMEKLAANFAQWSENISL